MSREILIELGDAAAESVSAGAGTLRGSGRMTRAASAVGGLAKRVPALAPVAKLADDAVSANSAPALLGLLSACRQVRASLSDVEASAGPFEPIGRSPGRLATPVQGNSLAAVLEKFAAGQEREAFELLGAEPPADLRLLDRYLSLIARPAEDVGGAASKGLAGFGPAAQEPMLAEFKRAASVVRRRLIGPLLEADPTRYADAARELARGDLDDRLAALEAAADYGSEALAEELGLACAETSGWGKRPALACLARCRSKVVVPPLMQSILARRDFDAEGHVVRAITAGLTCALADKLRECSAAWQSASRRFEEARRAGPLPGRPRPAELADAVHTAEGPMISLVAVLAERRDLGAAIEGTARDRLLQTPMPDRLRDKLRVAFLEAVPC